MGGGGGAGGNSEKNDDDDDQKIISPSSYVTRIFRCKAFHDIHWGSLRTGINEKQRAHSVDSRPPDDGIRYFRRIQVIRTNKYGSASSLLLDLTGCIRCTERYYFALGGSAEIWKGEWVQKDSGTAVEVRT